MHGLAAKEKLRGLIKRNLMDEGTIKESSNMVSNVIESPQIILAFTQNNSSLMCLMEEADIRSYVTWIWRASNWKGRLNYEAEKGLSRFINTICHRCGDLDHHYAHKELRLKFGKTGHPKLIETIWVVCYCLGCDKRSV